MTEIVPDSKKPRAAGLVWSILGIVLLVLASAWLSTFFVSGETEGIMFLMAPVGLVLIVVGVIAVSAGVRARARAKLGGYESRGILPIIVGALLIGFVPLFLAAMYLGVSVGWLP